MTEISFDGEQLKLDTSEDAEIICEKLDGEEVAVLYLQGNTFGVEACERIGQSLAKQSSLVRAHFKDMFTSRSKAEIPPALTHLMTAITNSGARLTLLDLSDNAFGPIGVKALISYLLSDSAQDLEELYLNNCGMGPEGSSTLATALGKLSKLRVMECGRNRLEDKGATAVGGALSELTNLERLMIPQNGINPRGIEQLVEVIKSNKSSLQTLNMADNTIKADGCSHLASGLIDAISIVDLNLSDALLGAEGFSLICKALAKSNYLQNMTNLAVEGNEIEGDEIIDTIIDTFKQCSSNFTLNLLENDFDQEQRSILNLGLSPYIQILLDEDDEEDDEEYRSEHSEIDNSVDFEQLCVLFVKSAEDDLNNEAGEYLNQILETTINNYIGAQILCIELGLMKQESTRKKKPLASRAISFLHKRSDQLPESYRNLIRFIESSKTPGLTSQ